MRKDEIIYHIHQLGCEHDIMNYLVNWSRNQLNDIKYKNRELTATVKAIKAINNSSSKDEAIEALCSEGE